MTLTPQPGKDNFRTLALLGSLCLFLSAIEYLIPKPLPFMRIGLANLPLLLALDIVRPKHFILLVLLKVLGQGIISGSLFSYVFLFSIAGTFSSAALMYTLRKLLGKKHLSFIGLSCAGAITSNSVQLILARYFIFGPALRYLIPPFLASGFITGIVLGVVCEYFCRRSIWYAGKAGTGDWGTQLPKALGTGDCCSQFELTPEMALGSSNYDNISQIHPNNSKSPLVPSPQSPVPSPHSFSPHSLFIAGLVMMAIFLFNRSLEGRVVQFLFFCLLTWIWGKKPNVLVTVLFMAGIVLCNVLVPYGKVLAAIGPLRITHGSLFAGLEKAFTLGGLVMLSRACIRSDLRLPGTIGSLLGESLQMLELMREKKHLINKRRIIAGIDTMLLELETINMNSPEPSPKPNVKSILLLSAIVLLSAALGFIPRFF